MEPVSEFFIPGTFQSEENSDERRLHEAGMDLIGGAFDHLTGLMGGQGYDPTTGIYHQYSHEIEEAKKADLPQWGPPFVKFVDGRISDLEKKVDQAIEKWNFQTRTIVFSPSSNTDSSGNIDPPFTVYESKPGFTLALHRILIILDGSTYGAPYTNAGSYWELRINGEMILGGSTVSTVGSLPVEINRGTRDAPRVRDGEVLQFFCHGLAASKRITLKCQGSLDRTIEG